MRRTHGTRHGSTSRRDTPSCISSSRPTSIDHLRKSLQKVSALSTTKLTNRMNFRRNRTNWHRIQAGRKWRCQEGAEEARHGRHGASVQEPEADGRFRQDPIRTATRLRALRTFRWFVWKRYVSMRIKEPAKRHQIVASVSAPLAYHLRNLSSLFTLHLLVLSIQVLHKALIMQGVDGDYKWL